MRSRAACIYAGVVLSVMLSGVTQSPGAPLLQARDHRTAEWISTFGSKCIGTANNGSMANGTPLVIWDCHGHPDQQWALSALAPPPGTRKDPDRPYGELLKNVVSGKCVGTANNGSMAPGTPLVVWDCHGHPDQRWVLTTKNLLINAASMVSEVAARCVMPGSNGSMTNGTALVVGTCEEKPYKYWTISRRP